MVKDLAFPLRIVAGRTVREKDGLAMSSRNAYLDAGERTIAPTLYRVLQDCAEKIKQAHPIEGVIDEGRKEIERAGFVLDYLAARQAETLKPIGSKGDGPIRILVAAKLGTTRLIDNIRV